MARDWLPDAVGGVVWFAPHAAHTNVYTPFPCGLDTIPPAFTWIGATPPEWTAYALLKANERFWVTVSTNRGGGERERERERERAIDAAAPCGLLQLCNYIPWLISDWTGTWPMFRLWV